jgi:autophagy-related protein 16-1
MEFILLLSILKIRFLKLKPRYKAYINKLTEKDEYWNDLKDTIQRGKQREKELKWTVNEITSKFELEINKFEITKMTLNEMVDKNERITHMYNNVTSENDKLKTDVKAMQNDNALLFKKVVGLQDELVKFYNDSNAKNQAYVCEWKQKKQEEHKQPKQRAMSMMETVQDKFDIAIEEGKNEDFDFKFDMSFGLPRTAVYKKVVDEWEVTSLTYNFRGTSIATGSANGVLKLWDPLHGGEVKSLKNYGQAVWALSFSSDNQNLMACYVDGSIRVWQTDDMKLVNNFHGHSDTINCSSFSHTDNALITGSSDRKIKLWDINKGVCTKSFSAFSGCLSVDSLPYGSLIASGHQDGTVKFWTPRQKDFIEKMAPHDSPITSVNFTHDGRYLLTTSQDHTVKLIDVKQFEEISMFEHENYLNGSKTSRSCISPTGDYAVIGSKNGSVIILKLKFDEIELEEIYNGEHSSWVSIWNWQPSGGSFSTADVKGNFIIWQ